MTYDASPSPGGDYEGMVVTCSECLQVQIFEDSQCCGCHSDFGVTAWPFADLVLLEEDMVSRGVDDAADRVQGAEARYWTLALSFVGKMTCMGPWNDWILCPEMGLECETCPCWQYDLVL